jgi:hypothetical protein
VLVCTPIEITGKYDADVSSPRDRFPAASGALTSAIDERPGALLTTIDD